MKFIMIGIYLFISALGLILFKLGATNSSAFSFVQGIFNLSVSSYSILGVICYGISFILYLGLVSKYNLSYIVPVTTGIMQVVILLASSFIFKEVITALHIIGVIIVLIGIAFINL